MVFLLSYRTVPCDKQGRTYCRAEIGEAVKAFTFDGSISSGGVAVKRVKGRPAILLGHMDRPGCNYRILNLDSRTPPVVSRARIYDAVFHEMKGGPNKSLVFLKAPDGRNRNTILVRVVTEGGANAEPHGACEVTGNPFVLGKATGYNGASEVLWTDGLYMLRPNRDSLVVRRQGSARVYRLTADPAIRDGSLVVQRMQ